MPDLTLQFPAPLDPAFTPCALWNRAVVAAAENPVPLVIAVEGENMRGVTWVRIQEFEGGDWAIGGKTLHASDVKALAAGKAA